MTEDSTTYFDRKIKELEARVAALESKARGPAGLFRHNGIARDDLRGETYAQMVERVRKWAEENREPKDE